jgi:hypothetical protein
MNGRAVASAAATFFLSLCTGLCAGLCVNLGIASASHAESLRYCDAPAALSAVQQDRLLRWAAVIKNVLDDSTHSVALVSRSGLDLARLGQRFSHAGVALREGLATPWAVRQLYYACEEREPRLFDQGMAGFVMGTQDPMLGHVSIVLLPPAAAQPLQAMATNKAQALQLLGSHYSANAYAFSVLFQNCNQWVVELLAAAWGEAVHTRADAQRWLLAAGYVPSHITLGSRLWWWLASALPWLHTSDHPEKAAQQLTFQVSMPQSIEDFVRAVHPQAQRIELCHNAQHIVVRKGWVPIAQGCVPEPQDQVISLCDETLL